MKLSEVTINDLKQYAQVFHNDDDNLFETILVASKNFISTYTGLPLVDDPSTTDVVEDNCDKYEDLTIALFAISNEMYDNRAIIVDNTKLNFVIMTILDSHSVNFL
jgi:phosphoribosylaminoimidazole-succinocarboxamide synthase